MRSTSTASDGCRTRGHDKAPGRPDSPGGPSRRDSANWVGQCNDHPRAGRRRSASSWNLCVGEQVVVMGKRLAIPVPVGVQVSGHSGEGTALDQKVPEPESSVVDSLEYLQLVSLHVEREEIGACPRLKPWPVIYHFEPRLASGRETIRAVRETRR